MRNGGTNPLRDLKIETVPLSFQSSVQDDKRIGVILSEAKDLPHVNPQTV